MDLRGHKDQPARLARKALRGLKERLGLQEHKALQVAPVHKAQPGHRERQDRRAFKALLARKVCKAR